MIEFVYPWFFLLLGLPFIMLFVADYKVKKHSVQVPYFDRLVQITGEKPESGAVTVKRQFIQKIIVSLAWVCIVTAIAKPEIIGEPVIQKKSARDLMIAVDLSGSMSVEDFTIVNEASGKTSKVNRLVAVKQVLRDFVKQRENDRLGLILFGDAPYLQAPFTADLATWLTLLNESEIGMAGQSTAFGDSIGLAISAFENAETKNRVMIVLTDGNDNSSRVPPVEAAKVAAASNIKIYTIAIGDPEVVGEDEIDLDILNQIVDITGGVNYQAMDRAELELVYKEINRLEPALFDTQSFRPRHSIHHYPLILFTVIYLLALLVVTTRYTLSVKRKQ